MKKLPDLEAWAIFAKVADTGSFARTAQELSLSQATVSKAISRLETRLKTMLLHRTSRRVALTDAGLAALERATRILQEGESVETEVMDHATSLRGQVRVAAPMSFGIARLAPLLPGFMLQHPEVELQVHFSDVQMDLIAERFDLALRIANLEDSSLLARQLCRVRLLLVGSPAYFQRHGQPLHPSDLLRHRALLYGHTPSSAPWHFRHPQLGEFTQVMHAQLQANNAEALTPALLAGMGLALQPAFLVWPLLQSGQLQIAMEDWQADPIALHILTPPGRIRPARVQAFIDYVAACLPQEPWVELQ
ncbi:MAG: LysR family transcriptional regulator [Comamonas sp.]